MGGLSARHQLIIADQRGTGRSEIPADPASYRCDRLAGDVEALRARLGLDTLDLLGHSAGASIALHYAARWPRRVRRLVLVTPSTRAIGGPATIAERRAVIAQRQDQPWFAAAAAAFERSYAGQEQAGDRDELGPLCYARWDAAARRHHAAEPGQQNPAAARPSAPPALRCRRDPGCAGRVRSPVLSSPGNWTSAPRRPGSRPSPVRCSRSLRGPSCPAPGTIRGWTSRPRSPR
ncbi:MAG TPA: alpha/beta fold hydrolase [Streptosporangiaceae bacterium]